MITNIYPTKSRVVSCSCWPAHIWVANSTGEKCVRRCMTYSRGWDSVTTAPAACRLSSQPVRHRRQNVE